MDTRGQRSARIIGALEELVAQEAAALANLDFTTVAALQERAAALIGWLTTDGAAEASRPELRARLQAVQARRQRSSDWLAAEMARGREELAQAGAAQRRVAQIAPVYGRSPAAVSAAAMGRARLQAVG